MKKYRDVARSDTEWVRNSVSLCAAADELFESVKAGSDVYGRIFSRDAESGDLRVKTDAMKPDDVRILGGMMHKEVAVMLLGMAFEVLAKGILVRLHPELVDERGCIASEVATHDLVPLLSRFAFPLSREETRVLHVISEYVTWAGRYPAPRREPKIWKVAEDGWEDAPMDCMHLWSVARPVFGRLEDLDEAMTP